VRAIWKSWGHYGVTSQHSTIAPPSLSQLIDGVFHPGLVLRSLFFVPCWLRVIGDDS
jgi:hypothetical protein